MVAIGRIAKNYGRMLFDPKYQEVLTNSIAARKRAYKIAGKSAYTDFHKNIGDAFNRAEKKTIKTPFWKNLKESLKTLFPDIKNTIKNTDGIWNKTKGTFKQLGKRMPLIGTLMIAATELPNIFSAFKDKGIIGGVTETGKAGLRLGGATVAGAIGQALIPIPFVGGLVGFIAGDLIMSKIVGKSHSEEKAEALAQAEVAEQQAQLLQQQLAQQYGPMYAQNQFGTQTAGMTPTMTQQQLMALQQQLYGSGNAMNDDFMANATGINKLNYQV